MGPGGNQDAIVVAQTGPSVLGMNLAKVIAMRVFFLTAQRRKRKMTFVNVRGMPVKT